MRSHAGVMPRRLGSARAASQVAWGGIQHLAKPACPCCISQILSSRLPIAAPCPRSIVTVTSYPSNLSSPRTLHPSHPKLVRNRWASNPAEEARVVPARSPHQSRSPSPAPRVLGQGLAAQPQVGAGEVKINGKSDLSGDPPARQGPPRLGGDQPPRRSVSGLRLHRTRTSASHRPLRSQ